MTQPIHFKVLEVHCRKCHLPIEVCIPDGIPPAEMLDVCERQAEATHRCEQPYFEPGYDDQADAPNDEEPLVP